MFGLGGSLGAGAGSIPGAVAGAGGGAALAQGLLDAGAPLIDPTGQGTKATPTERITAPLRTGAIEGAGTALLGVGKIPGLVQKAVAKPAAGLFRRMLGISKGTQDHLIKNQDRLREVAKKLPTTVNNTLDVAPIHTPLLQKAWKNSEVAFTKAHKELMKDLRPTKVSPTQLGITDKNMQRLLADKDTHNIARDIMEIIAKKQPKSKAFAGVKFYDKPINGATALEIYRKLARPKSNIDLAHKMRGGISGYFTHAQPKTAKKWRDFINATRTKRTLEKHNEGFPLKMRIPTPRGPMRMGDNVTPKLLDNFHNKIQERGQEAGPLLKSVRKALGDKGSDALAHAQKDALALEALRKKGGGGRLRIPYPNTIDTLRSIVEATAQKPYEKAMKTLYGPNVPLPRGIDRFMRPIDPLRDRMAGHLLREALVKRPLKELPQGIGQVLESDTRY